MLRRFVAALLISLLLAGCAANRPERKNETTQWPDEAKTHPAAVRTIRILSFPDNPLLDAVISGFNKKHPYIRVVKVPYFTGTPSQFDSTAILREKLERGEVDLFPVMGEALDLAPEGHILALDPYIHKSSFDMGPFASVTGPFRLEGKTYGLPLYLYPQAILCNADMFAAKSIPLPKQGWTWDEFRAAARKLTSGSGDAKVWGLAYAPGIDHLAMTMLAEYTEDGGRLDPEAAKRVLQYWSTVMNTDQSIKPKAMPAAVGERVTFFSPTTEFENGSAAMTLLGLSEYQWLEWKGGANWAFAPLPVAEGGKPTAIAYAQGIGIAADSPNIDAAWTFLQFYASEAGAVAIAKSGAMPVLRTEAVRHAWFDRSPAPPPGTEYYLKAELRALELPRGGKNGKILYAFIGALQPVLQGTGDGEEQFQRFTAERERILSEP